MASTYSNDLRLEEQAVGENSGTWGTRLNGTVSQIADGFSYGTKAMSSDANETFTMPDGTADATRSLYLKITSSATLTATRTVTLGPNTVSKLWLVENATTGSQSIIIKQGTGGTVTIASGGVRLIYTDGAGAGAAVVDAFTDLATSGTFTAGGVLTANAGVVVDNITIDGTEIDLSSGDLTVDVAGDIIFDADGDDFFFAAAGTNFGKITNSSSDFLIRSLVEDKDIIFKGADGGSTITALTLDMSAAGKATFNSHIALGDSKQVQLGADADFIMYHDGTSNYVQAAKQDSDIILRGNDGGSGVNMLTLDTSAAGKATFNAGATFGDDTGIGGTPSAGYRLDVIDSGATLARIRSTADSDVSQYFYSAGTTATQNIFFGDTGNTAAGGIRYYHNGDNLTFIGKGSGSEMARFNSSGQLGIGTTAPAYTLDVDSSIHVGNDGGSGFSHSRLIFDSGATSRAAGNFFHNQGDDVEYFAGSPYNKSDSFAICRNATASHADSTSNITNALVVVDSAGNLHVGGSTTPSSSAGNLVLNNGTAPSGSATNGVVLYAEDVSSSSELKVRDEAGNVTTLSPHNFDLIPDGPSEDMAWSYFSERDGKRINVDMLKALRVLERISGEQLIFEN